MGERLPHWSSRVLVSGCGSGVGHPGPSMPTAVFDYTLPKTQAVVDESSSSDEPSSGSVVEEDDVVPLVPSSSEL